MNPLILIGGIFIVAGIVKEKGLTGDGEKNKKGATASVEPPASEPEPDGGEPESQTENEE